MNKLYFIHIDNTVSIYEILGIAIESDLCMLQLNIVFGKQDYSRVFITKTDLQYIKDNLLFTRDGYVTRSEQIFLKKLEEL